MNIAVFAGTFDPFTIGHKDIVERALPLFDHIVIGIGHNADKHPIFPIDQRLQAVRNAFADETKVSVEIFDGLTVDFARKHHASYLLRGVRSAADFDYERTMADANKEIGNIETVILCARPEFAHISSSLVRDLYRHHYDIKTYIV